jgi:hypothetical protein
MPEWFYEIYAQKATPFPKISVKLFPLVHQALPMIQKKGCVL